MMSRLHTIVIAAGSILLPGHAAKASEQRDYGEYLSGECTACHRDGSNETIPSIVGYDQESFIVIMNTYRNGERDNQAMVSVAKALDDEQIKALAVYFSSLKPKDN